MINNIKTITITPNPVIINKIMCVEFNLENKEKRYMRIMDFVKELKTEKEIGND